MNEAASEETRQFIANEIREYAEKILLTTGRRCERMEAHIRTIVKVLLEVGRQAHEVYFSEAYNELIALNLKLGGANPEAKEAQSE